MRSSFLSEYWSVRSGKQSYSALETDMRRPWEWEYSAVGHALLVEGDGYSHQGAELIIRRLGKVMVVSGHI
jgi:hypothetical protein